MLIKKKKTDVSGLVATIVLNIKVNEFKNKILVLSNLVKKTDYDAKILEIEGKYITTLINLQVTYLMQR